VARDRLYVPEGIDSEATRDAVRVLSSAVAASTRMSEEQAAERLLRLLGYMCGREGR
jgi:hypothetical protein